MQGWRIHLLLLVDRLLLDVDSRDKMGWQIEVFTTITPVSNAEVSASYEDRYIKLRHLTKNERDKAQKLMEEGYSQELATRRAKQQYRLDDEVEDFYMETRTFDRFTKKLKGIAVDKKAFLPIFEEYVITPEESKRLHGDFLTHLADAEEMMDVGDFEFYKLWMQACKHEGYIYIH